MREEKFKMERQGLIQVGDKVKISEFLSATNYSYIIEPATETQTASDPKRASSKALSIRHAAL